jgi:uncharacterized protein with PQ loop repeat
MKLSLIAAILSILATFPQLYRTLETGLLRDHHEYTMVLSLLANLLLLIYGYQTKDIGILIIGLWFVMYNSVLLSYKLL